MDLKPNHHFPSERDYRDEELYFYRDWVEQVFLEPSDDVLILERYKAHLDKAIELKRELYHIGLDVSALEEMVREVEQAIENHVGDTVQELNDHVFTQGHMKVTVSSEDDSRVVTGAVLHDGRIVPMTESGLFPGNIVRVTAEFSL
jgi:hypothetical protein